MAQGDLGRLLVTAGGVGMAKGGVGIDSRRAGRHNVGWQVVVGWVTLTSELLRPPCRPKEP